jgi:A/G-specific adenine glycosylase
VIALWSGLGYNRRALHLHRCATVVVERYDGRLPETLDQLLDLPGVGPYTARAVLAFAFERDVGVVDTNAARVLARWVGRPLARSDVQDAADACVPPGSGWAWNQAVLDLGATICTAREAACERCPVLRWCRWGGSERHDPDPAVGTAGTGGTQSRFEGSDRQGRGRLVEALRAGPVSSDPAELAAVMGWPGDEERSASVATQLVRDGLIVQDQSRYRLP